MNDVKWYNIPAKALSKITPTPFIEHQKELLATPLLSNKLGKMPLSICVESIDGDLCAMKTTDRDFHSSLSLFGPILLFLFWTIAVVLFTEQKKEHLPEIWEQVNLARQKYGEKDFYLQPHYSKKMEIVRYVNYSKEITFDRYLYYRYNGSDNNIFLILLDFLIFGTLISLTIFLPIYIRRFYKNPPPLFIDRKRQLFFSWRKGKVYAAHYSQVGFSQLRVQLHSSETRGLILYTLDRNNSLTNRIFSIHMYRERNSSSEQQKRFILPYVFIVNYLLYGKSPVFEGDILRTPAPRKCHEDEKPADFDEQITRILAALETISATRKNIHAPEAWRPDPSLLIEQEEDLLKLPAKPKSKRELKAFSMLKSINDKQCVLIGRSLALPRIFLFLLYLAIEIPISGWYISTFISHKEWEESIILEEVEKLRQEYGKNFHLKNDLPASFSPEKYIAGLDIEDNNSIPIWNFIYHRLHYDDRIRDKEYDSGIFNLYYFDFSDYIIYFGQFLIFILLILHILFLIPQDLIIIDRERQIIFSPSLKLNVARYQQVGISYQLTPLPQSKPDGLILYFISNKNTLCSTNFRFHITKCLWGKKRHSIHTDIQAFIINYIIKGKKSVSEIDFKRGSSLFWRTGRLSFYFDDKIEHILAELDKRNHEIQEKKTSNIGNTLP
ncbi:hypothetical protein ACP179_13650 [Xenorhabdus stockiae]|uniref:hypothetical protein n=1 Tax=Xenorhabdus stockiae TaxID=351614 RepID=UPI003CF5663D